jgi:Flp pilus assembly protein TadB
MPASAASQQPSIALRFFGVDHGMENTLIALYYLAAIVVIVLHYVGWLADRGLEWVVYVVAVLLFPMLYFAYLP